jgi:glycosyltransferase involved in cell wall biosynthesis
VANIAIVANTSWNIANFRLGLIKHLISIGHQVFVFAPVDASTDFIIASVDVEFIPLHNMSRKGTNPFVELKCIREIREKYIEYDISIAVLFTIKPNVYGSIASVRAKVKTIANVTGLGYVFINKSMVNSFISRLFKYGLSKARIVVFQNEIDRKLMIRKRMVEANKTKLILGSGINVDKFAMPIDCNLHKSFTFLYIGRLLYDKGVRELIAGFNKLSLIYPTVRLQLIGALDVGNPAGIAEDQLKNWLYVNKNISYLGLSNNLPEIIAPVHCVVLPSYREGLPKSLLEAMSMSKPIITTNAPGCSQLIENGKNGIICKARHEDSLFEAMRKMLELRDEDRAAMGQHGRLLAETVYNEQLIVRQYEQLISEVM